MSWVWFQDALGKGITNFSVVADTGSFVLTGNDVGASIPATTVDYALTGLAAGLDYNRAILASTVDYVLTGNAIGQFIRTHLLAAARGEYKLEGQKALLIATKIPIQNPAKYVENAWVQPENEGNLDAEVEWEA